MSIDNAPEAGGTPLQQPYVVLSGEGVGALSAEAIEELRLHAVELAGGLSVEATTSTDLASVERGTLAEQGLEPVPVTRAQMLAFAVEHGYPERRGMLAWLCVRYTQTEMKWRARRNPDSPDAYPVRYLDDLDDLSGDKNLLDLRSVYERLMGTKLSITAWDKGTPDKVKFLTHFVNSVMQPEEPLRWGRRR